MTHPPYGPLSLVQSPGDLIPISIGGAMAGFNLWIWGPRTQEAMVQRIHQGNMRMFERKLSRR